MRSKTKVRAVGIVLGGFFTFASAAMAQGVSGRVQYIQYFHSDNGAAAKAEGEERGDEAKAAGERRGEDAKYQGLREGEEAKEAGIRHSEDAKVYSERRADRARHDHDHQYYHQAPRISDRNY
jgi:hypothetical protein